jgi:DNA-binding IclR family transcriptional regulator
LDALKIHMARSTRRSQIKAKPAKEIGGQGIVAVRRALQLIELLAETDAGAGVSLSDLARQLGVNKQIAFRLVGTLSDAGFVYKNPHSELISLSYKISNIGLRKLVQDNILDQAGSVTRELAEKTGELVRLAVVERDDLVWVLANMGRQQMLNINPNYAPRITLNTTATGKAWLSTMPLVEANRILDRHPPVQRTRHAVTDRAKIHKELELVRTVGWALSFEESELGIGAVAAPIVVQPYGGRPLCVGTISLAAPVQRMDREALKASAPLVVAATKRLAQMWPQFLSEQDVQARGFAGERRG